MSEGPPRGLRRLRRLAPNGRTLPPGLDEDVVADVVTSFYKRARADELLGPVFNSAIPEEAWPHHLATVTDFWSSMMLGTARYSGRPLPKHLALDGISGHHFARWLELFRTTVAELCDEDAARLFVERSERIAQSFQSAIAFHRSEEPVG